MKHLGDSSILIHLDNDRKDYRRREDARVLLNNILMGEMPNNILSNLYPGCERAILTAIDKFSILFNPRGWKLREHKETSGEISDKIIKTQENQYFQNIIGRLLDCNLPSESDVELFFGNYKRNVLDVFSLFLEKGILRKCNNSATVHHMGVGGVIYFLFDSDSEENRFMRSSEGALHDTIEDLLPLSSLRDRKGMPYGLERHDDFVNDFIDPDLRESTIMLTNYYDLIIKYVAYKLSDEKRIFTLDSLKSELKKLGKKSDDKESELFLGFKPAGEYIKDILHYSERFGGYEKSEELLQNLMWLCYIKYIREIAQRCNQTKNLRTYEIKAIDLADNFSTMYHLDMTTKLKILLKQGIWATEARLLNTDWAPLNNHADELMENSLKAAEEIVIDDLSRDFHYQRHFRAALRNIRNLEMIFYENRYKLF